MKYQLNIFQFMIITSVIQALLACNVIAACNPNIVRTKPDEIYTDYRNGKITDNETGLMWMKCALGQSDEDCSMGSARAMNWKQALESVQAANTASLLGDNDWRLPSTSELGTLVEKACISPAINTVVFPSTLYRSASYYWSASPNAVDNNNTWVVYFMEGGESLSNKANNGYVRLVRGGQR
jgi:hypothetical protein